MRHLIKAIAFGALMLPTVAAAQSQETLADIRQELTSLSNEVQKLKQELTTTGAGGDAALGTTLLERTSAIENELMRLTGKTEQLELRINSVVSDGSNRIGDLEFRLCELETNCDPANLGEGKPLGGKGAQATQAPTATTAAAPAAAPADTTGGVELAANEKSDFDRAKETYDSGDHATAAKLLKTYGETYPGGPFATSAALLYGEALLKTGDTPGAARAWLDAYTRDPEGPQAPQAVLRLGHALGVLGKKEEACLTLGEIPTRFAGSEAVSAAQTEMQTLGCQ